MVKAAKQNNGKAISKRADWKEDVATATGAGIGGTLGGIGGAVSGGLGGAFTGGRLGAPGAIFTGGLSEIAGAGEMGVAGAATGGVAGATGGAALGTLLANKLYNLVASDPTQSPTLADTMTAIKSSHPNLSNDQQTKTANCLITKMTVAKGKPLTQDQVTQCLPVADIKLPPTNQPTQQLPQATSETPVASMSKILLDKGFLPVTAGVLSSWTPEFDAAFREFIDAGTGAKANMVGGADWNAVAQSLGFGSGLNGALDAVAKLNGSVKSKWPTGETPAAGTTEAAKPVTPEKEDVLAKILSVMQNTKLAETVGLNLVAEPRRASILIEAAGGVGNASAVLRNKTEGLSEALAPVVLTGQITPEWVRRNKPVLQQIVGAINALVSQAVKHVGKLSLLPADRQKAVEKMKSFISQATQNLQWTKLASQRKDRIRSEVAAEMTVADKITARRIRARESV